MKKMVSIIAAIIAVVCALSIHAFAAETNYVCTDGDYDDYKISINNQTAFCMQRNCSIPKEGMQYSPIDTPSDEALLKTIVASSMMNDGSYEARIATQCAIWQMNDTFDMVLLAESCWGTETANMTRDILNIAESIDINDFDICMQAFGNTDAEGYQNLLTFDVTKKEVEPTEPEIVEPTEPEVVEPTEPEIVEPTEPEVVEPTEPEVVEPTEPEVVEPTEPEVVEPTEPEVVEPTEPEVVEPTEPEVVEPTEPEVVEPTEPEVVEPTEPEVVEPTEPEVVEPTEPEVVEPTEPEVPEEVIGGEPTHPELPPQEVIGGGPTAPKTGDETPIIFFVNMMVISVFGIALLIKNRKAIIG